MKKGDLSINIIIVAAIALLILVIISVLLFRSGGQIREGTESCTYVGGQCDPYMDCSSVNDYAAEGEKWVYNPTRKCSNPDEYCCTRT